MERRQQQEVNLSNEKNCRINQLPISVDRWRQGPMHRYQKSQNRLLNVCCVHTTSAGLPRVSFFFSFFVAAAIYSTNKANKAGGTCR
jgi:hypothetical protein